MAYEGTDHSWIKRVGGFGLTVIVLLIVGALARGGTREAINYAKTSPMAVEAELNSAMSKNPSFQTVFSALERNYPEAHQRFIEELSASMRQGASQADLNRQSFNFMRSFVMGLRKDFGAAPDRDVFVVRDKTIELVNLLSTESSLLCAQFAMDGLQQGAQLSDQATALVAQTSALTIEAAAAGRKLQNSRGAPTDEDWEMLLLEILDSGISETELNHLIEGTYSSLSVETQCAVGTALYSGLAAIPDDASARLSAELLIPSNP